MIKKMVDITSKEFKEAVLKVINQCEDLIDNLRYERLPDGWIKDHETDLEWGPSSPNSMNYAKAKEYCANLKGRLPTVDELQTILDRTLHNPTCDKKVFKDVKSEWYWTSSKYMGCDSAAWCVSFAFGNVVGIGEDVGNYVRPVRASQ